MDMNKINKIIKTNKKKREQRINLYSNVDWEKAVKLFQKYPSQVSQNHKYPPVKDILSVLAKVGGIALIFAFPGAAPAIGALFSEKNSYEPWKVRNTVYGMAKRKLVTVEESDDGRVVVRITKNGLTKALGYKLDEMELIKPKKWDGRWRAVIFDIPEKYRRLRDVFRMRLRQMGLYLLQESVYVSPYPCFDEVEFLRELYNVSFRAKYLLVERIEDDEKLRRHFSLF